MHGEPLGPEETKLTKQNLSWPQEPSFLLPDEAVARFRQALETGPKLERDWQESFNKYRDEHRDLAAACQQWISGQLPEGWHRDIPIFDADPKGMATRVASGTVLNAVAANVPNLIGGSADLAPSNKTVINGEKDMQATQFDGRNMRFGVREHAMGSILNGMALHGGLRPYGGTFLVFSDYMRPAIRLAALMKLPVIYVFTHDSIGLGEDGPTHQPIEHLASLRAIPNLTVIRPADANETAEAWKAAVSNTNGPTALSLTRQGLPTLDRNTLAAADGLHRGGYILKEPESEPARVILIGSGSEIDIALKAALQLSEHNIAARVVSMPCWELFDAQPDDYRRKVLPPEIPVRVAVEAGSRQGWSRYVGSAGAVIGLDHFGASAPSNVLYQKFDITAENIVEKTLSLMA